MIDDLDAISYEKRLRTQILCALRDEEFTIGLETDHLRLEIGGVPPNLSFYKPMQKSLYTREYQQKLKLLRAKRVEVQVSQAELAELAERLQWTQAEVSVRRVDVIDFRVWLDALGNDLSEFVAELYGHSA